MYLNSALIAIFQFWIVWAKSVVDRTLVFFFLFKASYGVARELKRMREDGPERSSDLEARTLEIVHMAEYVLFF